MKTMMKNFWPKNRFISTLLAGVLIVTIAPIAIWRLTATAVEPNQTSKPRQRNEDYRVSPPFDNTPHSATQNASSGSPMLVGQDQNSQPTPPGFHWEVLQEQLPVTATRMTPGADGTQRPEAITTYRAVQSKRLVPNSPQYYTESESDTDRQARDIAQLLNRIPESQRDPDKLKELRRLLDEAFNARLEKQEERLTKLSDEVSKTREILEQRKLNQVEIVERRMRELLGSPDPMSWGFEPNQPQPSYRSNNQPNYQSNGFSSAPFRANTPGDSAGNQSRYSIPTPSYTPSTPQEKYGLSDSTFLTPVTPMTNIPYSTPQAVPAMPAQPPQPFGPYWNAPLTPSQPQVRYSTQPPQFVEGSPNAREDVINIGFELLKAKAMLQRARQTTHLSFADSPEVRLNQIRVVQLTEVWKSRRESALRYKELVTAELDRRIGSDSQADEASRSASILDAKEKLAGIEKQLEWMDDFEKNQLPQFDEPQDDDQDSVAEIEAETSESTEVAEPF